MKMQNKTAKYKIEFDRPKCIGAAACAATYPEGWKIADDTKAELLGEEVKKRDDEWRELIINEKYLKNHLEAAESCPVNVIHITNLETGEKLI